MAIILEGKKLANEIKKQVKQEVIKCQEKYQKVPHLAVVLVGDDPASITYAYGKEKACRYTGIESTIIVKDKDISENELIDSIKELNNNPDISAILLQLPLPKHLNAEKIIAYIDPLKDIDGITPLNMGYLFKGQPVITPCTPLGVMKILEKYKLTISGQNCVIIGASQIVGKPMASLLLSAGGTISVCHIKTKNTREIAKTGDILVVAIGSPNFIDDTYVKPGAIVIDVGISRVEDKIIGDVDFEKVKDIASYITPVPGGVGPMTIACLMENALLCFKKQNGEK